MVHIGEVHDEHGETAVVHHGVADATEQDGGDVTAVARADDDEVVTPGFRLVKDGFGRHAVDAEGGRGEAPRQLGGGFVESRLGFPAGGLEELVEGFLG